VSTLQSRRVDVEGLAIHALVADAPPVSTDAPAVVLVHGQGMSSRYMEPLGRCLARFAQVHAPDQPGFGASGKPQQALGLEQLADFHAAYLQAVGVGRAALLGNSFGCQIAVACAERHPEAVDRLVLQGPTADPDSRTVFRIARRWFENSRRESSNLGFLLAEYRRAGFGRVAGTFREMLRDRMEDRLPKVAPPVLVVRGDRDPIVPQAWAERVAALAPHGRLVVVPGAAHTMNHYQAEALARVVEPFLLGGEPA
jgi:2-hydroxy-6-oxonona-2,4-dienedioate hydrolase